MNQKLENILNLSLEATPEERLKSQQLNVGFEGVGDIWELIVKYNGNISRLQNELITVEELIAGYAIVRIPESLITTFSELDEIEYVEKPKRLYFSIIQGKEASCVFQVTERDPLLTGSRTLVAVIDSGIDYTSPEFRDASGRTRILALWDQTLTAQQVNDQLTGYSEIYEQAAAPPEGFQTGVEFSEERINEALNSDSPERIVPSRDTSGHGTSVAAIAAAGGRVQGGIFRGVAPESSLLIVKLGSPLPNSFPKTTELMRAVTYVVQKAVELNMPVAINLSFGNTYGSHDGTSLLERFLDNAAEIGKTVICVGSGNEGAAAGHVSGILQTEERIELSVSEYQTSFSIQLWKDFTDEIELQISSPGGETIIINPNRAGGNSYVAEETQLLVYSGEPSPYSVDQEFYIDLIPVGSYVNSGIWSIQLRPIRIVTGNYNFYLPSSAVLNPGTRFFTPNPYRTLTIPSTSQKVITVGAYQPGLGAYADFSGRGGITDEGTDSTSVNVKPDLVAPGVDIQTIAPNNSYVQVTGTSFATPFVTGGAALMMEWGIVRGNDPFLYGEKVKAYLRRGARQLPGMATPNPMTGWGALCLQASLPG